MKRTKQKKQLDVFGIRRTKKKLKRTAGFVMDVGVAQMMISTAKGLK